MNAYFSSQLPNALNSSVLFPANNSLISAINALNSGDFATASSLQVEMYDKMEELKELYATYRNNMI